MLIINLHTGVVTMAKSNGLGFELLPCSLYLRDLAASQEYLADKKASMNVDVNTAVNDSVDFVLSNNEYRKKSFFCAF